MNDLFTRIAKRGAHVFVGPGATDSRALAQHLIALRVAGHAIVADEIIDSDRKSLGVRITHYLTCTKCQP